MKTHFYAYLYPCGVVTRSETGRLYRHLVRFSSRKERDKWVAKGNDTARTMPEFREPVTRDGARPELRRVIYWWAISGTAERGY